MEYCLGPLDNHVLERFLRGGLVYEFLVPIYEPDGDNCVCCTWDDETGNCNGTWCNEDTQLFPEIPDGTWPIPPVIGPAFP